MFLLFEMMEDGKSGMFFSKGPEMMFFFSIKQGAISSADFRRINSALFVCCCFFKSDPVCCLHEKKERNV